MKCFIIFQGGEKNKLLDLKFLLHPLEKKKNFFYFTKIYSGQIYWTHICLIIHPVCTNLSYGWVAFKISQIQSNAYHWKYEIYCRFDLREQGERESLKSALPCPRQNPHQQSGQVRSLCLAVSAKPQTYAHLCSCLTALELLIWGSFYPSSLWEPWEQGPHFHSNSNF